MEMQKVLSLRLSQDEILQKLQYVARQDFDN